MWLPGVSSTETSPSSDWVAHTTPLNAWNDRGRLRFR